MVLRISIVFTSIPPYSVMLFVTVIILWFSLTVKLLIGQRFTTIPLTSQKKPQLEKNNPIKLSPSSFIRHLPVNLSIKVIKFRDSFLQKKNIKFFHQKLLSLFPWLAQRISESRCIIRYFSFRSQVENFCQNKNTMKVLFNKILKQRCFRIIKQIKWVLTAFLTDL